MFWFLPVIFSYSQCNSRLMELAAARSGTDAIFIRDFKVKLDEGTMKRPSPVGRFQVYLKEGIHYRFNVANDADYEGRAILQLYDRNKLMGSTFNTDTRTDNLKFDFVSEKAGQYQVVLSFFEGKSGCAVGIMSMVLSDTMAFSKHDREISENDYEVLYIGVDNELNVAATNIPEGSLEVSISQGSIEGSNGRYVARVTEKGIVTVKVTARDKNGNISEVDSIFFRVSQIPLPYVRFGNQIGGFIQKNEISQINRIYLEYPFVVGEDAYTIIEFTISKENNTQTGEVAFNEFITPSQKHLIQELRTGERFVIRNIYVRGTDGATYTLEPVTFVID